MKACRGTTERRTHLSARWRGARTQTNREALHSTALLQCGVVQSHASQHAHADHSCASDPRSGVGGRNLATIRRRTKKQKATGTPGTNMATWKCQAPAQRINEERQKDAGTHHRMVLRGAQKGQRQHDYTVHFNRFGLSSSNPTTERDLTFVTAQVRASAAGKQQHHGVSRAWRKLAKFRMVLLSLLRLRRSALSSSPVAPG